MSTAEKWKSEAKWGAWVWIKWKHGAPDDACLEWKHSKWIKEAWSTTGEWDSALWLDTADPNEVEKIVWKEILTNKWVDKTETRWAKKYW